MTVVYFHRKNAHKYISIEAYFDNVRRHLPESINPVVAESKYLSIGFFKRVYNTIEAAFRQGDVNHITGEVHFLAILLQKKKTILTIHDLVFLNHPSPLARRILKYFWLTLPVQRAGLITAVSAATKKEIIRHSGCTPEKIHVIPTCIGGHFRRVDKPFNRDYPVLLQVGTSENKNGIRMARAIKGLQCRLEIIGRPTEAYLYELKNCGIDYNISTHLTDEAMLQKYIDCDVVLFASTYEGFGMPIIEANTVGRVVVTSNCSSMPEVAGGSAVLVDPFSVESIRTGVETAIGDAAARMALIEAGFKNATRFNIGRVSARYSELYQKLFSEN